MLLWTLHWVLPHTLLLLTRAGRAVTLLATLSFIKPEFHSVLAFAAVPQRLTHTPASAVGVWKQEQLAGGSSHWTDDGVQP